MKKEQARKSFYLPFLPNDLVWDRIQKEVFLVLKVERKYKAVGQVSMTLFCAVPRP